MQFKKTFSPASRPKFEDLPGFSALSTQIEEGNGNIIFLASQPSMCKIKRPRWRLSQSLHFFLATQPK